MKSRVVSYYDYKKLEIPEELTRWHIPDEEIWKELEFQAGDHAVEKRAEDAVKIGDSVRCVCVKASKEKWKDRTVLLYPGRGLPGAESAETAVLAMAWARTAVRWPVFRTLKTRSFAASFLLHRCASVTSASREK